jgi:hypothetical protein
MSRSIHITIKNFQGLTKKELDEQVIDVNSDLSHWADKRIIKRKTKENRKLQKICANALNLRYLCAK